MQHMASFSQDPMRARSRPSHNNSVPSGQQVPDTRCFPEGWYQDGRTGFQHGPAVPQVEFGSSPDHLSSNNVQTKDSQSISTNWQYENWNAESSLATAGNEERISSSCAWDSTQFYPNSFPALNYEQYSSTVQQTASSQPPVLPFESRSDTSIQESLWPEYQASNCAVPNHIEEFQQSNLRHFYNHSNVEYPHTKEPHQVPMSVIQDFTNSQSGFRDHYSDNVASASWNSSPTRAGAIDPPLHQDGLDETTTSNIDAQDTAAWFSQVREPGSPLVNLAGRNSPWSAEKVADGSHTHAITSPSDLIPEPPTTMIDPPTEDMNPENTKMTPQRSNLKDMNHLYMPRWIRGHGKHREGWCGACRPGRWLSLKRSTYWYHKNFFHGITVSGTTFPRPTRVQKLRDEKGSEGLCGTCDKWVALNGGKKGPTSWFRHAYKCGSSTPRASPSKAFFCQN